VIVTSGDGGWIHLAPQVADLLAGQGFFVVGFDARAYLAGFTTGSTTLRAEDVPGDFKALIELASRGSSERPVLIGVSEGAGLSVLAASDRAIKPLITGVIGLGISDQTELGWRWKDAVIYLTHGVPNEPTFSTAAIIDRMSPIPLALIHSLHDEYVPLSEAKNVFAHAQQPRRLWLVTASNHRFSDNEAEFESSLSEAVAWTRSMRAK
jgi:pimeloyl-ACP methyl ester carboxylesterase